MQTYVHLFSFFFWFGGSGLAPLFSSSTSSFLWGYPSFCFVPFEVATIWDMHLLRGNEPSRCFIIAISRIVCPDPSFSYMPSLKFPSCLDLAKLIITQLFHWSLRHSQWWLWLNSNLKGSEGECDLCWFLCGAYILDDININHACTLLILPLESDDWI